MRSTRPASSSAASSPTPFRVFTGRCADSPEIQAIISSALGRERDPQDAQAEATAIRAQVTYVRLETTTAGSPDRPRVAERLLCSIEPRGGAPAGAGTRVPGRNPVTR